MVLINYKGLVLGSGHKDLKLSENPKSAYDDKGRRPLTLRCLREIKIHELYCSLKEGTNLLIQCPESASITCYGFKIAHL